MRNAVLGVTNVIIHNSTKHDPDYFPFDFEDNPAPCRPLHFPANMYCLLAEAVPYLSLAANFSNARCDAARSEAVKLSNLYARQPKPRFAPAAVPTPSGLPAQAMDSIGRAMEAARHQPPRALQSIDGSPSMAHEGFVSPGMDVDELASFDDDLQAYRAEPSASSPSVASYQHRYGDMQKDETYRYFASLDYIKSSQGLDPHLFPGE
jgi:hypothetical protein